MGVGSGKVGGLGRRALLHFFEAGGKLTTEKRVLIVTSLLEDLVGVGGRGWVWGREKLVG